MIEKISYLKPSVVSLLRSIYLQYHFYYTKCYPFSQIKMEHRYKGGIGNNCLLSVDGTDCRIQKSGSMWSSHKFNKKASVFYEVALCIRTGDIYWVNGPFPCGCWPDISIFRESLMDELDECERVEADKGYIGESPEYCKVPGALYDHNLEYCAMKKRLVSRHETVNNCFKMFTCLAKPFCHGFTKYGWCFNAVAIITQLEFENGERLFDVDYDDNTSNRNA